MAENIATRSQLRTSLFNETRGITGEADNFFLKSSLVPKWSFDVKFERSYSFLSYLQTLQTHEHVDNLDLALKNILTSIHPWHVKGIQLPPLVQTEFDNFTTGNLVVSLPKYKIDNTTTTLGLTMIEDSEGNVSQLINIMKQLNIDVHTGFYRKYAISHCLNIEVSLRSGYVKGKKGENDTRDFYYFGNCSLVGADAETYDYGSDEVVTYNVKFKATEVVKIPGYQGVGFKMEQIGPGF